MTIAEWLGTNGQHRNPGRSPMSEPISPAPDNPRSDPRGTWSAAPDSEWLAEWAMIALSVGRIEMGAELARLARSAQRCEQHLGQHAAPEAPVDPPQLAVETPAPAPDATAVMPAPVTASAPIPPVVVPSGRCAVPLVGGRLCHGVAVYDAHEKRWVHMDPEIERDHQASVPPATFNAYDHERGNGQAG